MNQSITTEQQAEAIIWASDCIGLGADQKVGADFAYLYVCRFYPGGWDAFVAECCTFVQLDGYGSNYRPWESRPMTSVALDRV